MNGMQTQNSEIHTSLVTNHHNAAQVNGFDVTVKLRSVAAWVIAFRRLLMYPHDTYSGSNGLLMPFVSVGYNQFKSQVSNGSHVNKIIELPRSIFDLSYRLSIENSLTCIS